MSRSDFLLFRISDLKLSMEVAEYMNVNQYEERI